MKVLIVDDNSDDRSLLRYLLEHRGCSQVIEAVDGVEGLAMANLHKPDLIVSDALMPQVDGFQFLRAIKMSEALKSIPFVFYSAIYTGFKEEELALSLGAEAFIVKPKDPEELWVQLAAIMKNHARARGKTSIAGLQDEDEEFIRKYGEIVTAKLEEKIRDLEAALALRNEAVTALETHFAQFSRIFDSINAVVFVVDLEQGRFLFLNRHGCQLWGADWDGKTCSEFLPEECNQTRKTGAVGIHREEGSEQPYTWEFRATPADKWYQFIERVIPWTDGRPVRLAIGFDISERKEIERIKDEMVAAVSHELRTPLTAMMGYTEFLLGNEVPPGQQQEYLRIMLKETEKLNELIANFLNLQRLQMGHTRATDFLPVDMCAVLHDIVCQYSTHAKNHRITLDCPQGLDPISGNEMDLRMMMDNLVSNAVKFSPEGGDVFIGVRKKEDYMTIMVKDKGIGIPQDMMEKIFELFYQVDGTDRRRFCGTGLGLALVREIVKVHGGRTWAESTQGQGSSVYVSLPSGS